MIDDETGEQMPQEKVEKIIDEFLDRDFKVYDRLAEI